MVLFCVFVWNLRANFFFLEGTDALVAVCYARIASLLRTKTISQERLREEKISIRYSDKDLLGNIPRVY